MAENSPKSGPTGSSRWLAVAIGLVAVGLVLSVSALVILNLARDGAPTVPAEPASDPWRPDQGLEEMRVPGFALVDQNNRPVDEAMLDGRVTILDFIFTHCPIYCPEMSARMMDLNRQLEGTGVRFLSISIDPERDTPEVLREFASRFEADHTRWAFLTGEPEVVHGIGEEMGFAIQANEDDKIPTRDGGLMANLIHPTSLLLVGPDRQVLGRYSYQFDEEMEALAERARRLANDLD